MFRRIPVDVSGFSSTFIMQFAQSDADGLTFTVQGASPHALGGFGRGLGYGSDAASPFDRGAHIDKSVALKFGLIDKTSRSSGAPGAIDSHGGS